MGGDVPKAMLQLAGIPLLHHQLERLAQHGITETVLCLNISQESICRHFGETFGDMQLRYHFEDVRLGTGGAIRAALRVLRTRRPLFVLHGDVMAELNFRRMRAIHLSEGRTVTMATKQGRGVGIYVISPWLFDGFMLPRAFSFKRDFLAAYNADLQPTPYDALHYFIDINTPQDYTRAQTDHNARYKIDAIAA